MRVGGPLSCRRYSEETGNGNSQSLQSARPQEGERKQEACWPRHGVRYGQDVHPRPQGTGLTLRIVADVRLRGRPDAAAPPPAQARLHQHLPRRVHGARPGPRRRDSGDCSGHRVHPRQDRFARPAAQEGRPDQGAQQRRAARAGYHSRAQVLQDRAGGHREGRRQGSSDRLTNSAECICPAHSTWIGVHPWKRGPRRPASGNSEEVLMLEKFANIFRIPDLRKRVLFTLGLLAVYRLGAFIPTPGINADALAQYFNMNSGSLLGLGDLFTGGNLRRLTIFALGIMPYITASIIFQLLTVIYEPLAKLQKEGELGRRKITQWTRYVTVLLGVIQSFAIALTLTSSSVSMVTISRGYFIPMCVITLTAGTAFIMWLGEQITERGIGNGMSLLIFTGIVVGLPRGIMD